MNLIAIGTVRTAKGLKGWLKLKSFSSEWTHFSSLKTVLLRSRDSRREREYQVSGFRMQQGAGLLKLANIDSPEAGKMLAGCEILVPREFGAPLKEDEWYLGDLVGLTLVDSAGSLLGEIIGFVESADVLLEIQKLDGKVVLIPFRSSFVEEPDIEKGVIVLTACWLMNAL